MGLLNFSKEEVAYDATQDPFGLGQKASGYIATPDYQNILSQINTITGGDYDAYVNNLTDIGQMQTLTDFQKQALEGYQDYRLGTIFDSNNKIGAALSGLLDNADLYKYNFTNELAPIGSYNGKDVYPEIGLLSGNVGDVYQLDDSGEFQYIPIPEGSDFGFGSILSLATGGLSDVVQGDAPGASLGKVGEYAAAIFNPALASGYNIAEGVKEGDWGKVIENFVDPITEPGLDKIARGSGEVLMDAVPALVPYAPAIGSAIGALVGNVPGALAGYELGNKIAGGSHEQAILGGATIGATAGLGSVISPYISGAMPTGAVGNALSGATTGAITGAAGALPNAIETGDYNNLLKAALIGGAAGGIGGGFKQTTTPDGIASLDSFGLTAPSMYDASGALNEYGMSILSNNLSGLTSAPGSINAITNAYLNSPNYSPISPYGNILPDVEVMPGINPYSEPFSANTIKDAYGLPSYNTPTLNSPVVIPEQVYANAASKDMFYRPSTTSGQIGTLGKVYDKYSDPFASPSAFDNVRQYAGKAGNAVLKNADLIKKLANAFSVAGASGYATEERAGGSHSTPDTEWLSNIITSGTGVGKSKGLLAGEVEGPSYNGESFMPGLNEIKKYDKQNLYYS